MSSDEARPLNEICPGIYRHYKGNLYEVIGSVRHSETLEDLTLYRALYGEHGLWVRPSAMFNEVVWVDGKAMPRFALCNRNGLPLDHSEVSVNKNQPISQNR